MFCGNHKVYRRPAKTTLSPEEPVLRITSWQTSTTRKNLRQFRSSFIGDKNTHSTLVLLIAALTDKLRVQKPPHNFVARRFFNHIPIVDLCLGQTFFIKQCYQVGVFIDRLEQRSFQRFLDVELGVPVQETYVLRNTHRVVSLLPIVRLCCRKG